MINKATMELVMSEEAFMPQAYDDFGHLAIAYGRRDGFRGFKITPGMKVTKEQAYSMLRSDLYWLAHKVMQLFIDDNLSDNELGALTSFVYNLGFGTLKKGSIPKLIKEGNRLAAADKILQYNKARVDGKLKVLGGLTKRRKAERELFLSKKPNY